MQMANLVRHSQLVFTRAACITRASSTTSTSSGGAKVKPSGASENLSQASRAADGTDMAKRDAEQRRTTPDSGKAKSTAGGSAQTPQTGGSPAPWGKIGFVVVAAAGTYFLYNNFIKNQSPSKSSSLTNAQNKGNVHEPHTTNRDGSGGSKH